MLLMVCFVYSVVAIHHGWRGELIGPYAFREAQTAITVNSLLKGGPWLAYETPVLGPPWSIPFEFPLYQWIVALVVKSGFIALDQGGKLVSELFFFLSLFPLFKILRFLGLSRRQCHLILALYCVSPQYLFWSGSFMIESTALALSLLYLWLVCIFCRQMCEDRADWRVMVGVAVFGVLAGLVKVTTFFAFLAAGFIAIAWLVVRKVRETGWNRAAVKACVNISLVSIVLPIFAVLLWTAYADSLKVRNPLGATLVSNALNSWNFGTLAQKASLTVWKTFYFRTVTDLAGNPFVAAAVVAALVFCRRERLKVALVSLGLFVLVLATFTNLQYVHPYYSYANGVFLVVALGIAVTDLLESNRYAKRIAGAVLLCLLLGFSCGHFIKLYWPTQEQVFDFSVIRSEVESRSSEDDVFIVYGNDWSSEIPYHIRRRAAMIRNGTTQATLLSVRKNLAGYRIGGLIFFSRNGYTAKDKIFIDNAVKLWGIAPGYYSIKPWYKLNSLIFTVYNRAGAR